MEINILCPLGAEVFVQSVPSTFSGGNLSNPQKNMAIV